MSGKNHLSGVNLSSPDEIRALFDRHVVPTYKRSLVLSHGKGTEVWDVDGKRYLDFGGGVAVSSLGHSHPRMIAALDRQARELIHTSNLYYHRNQGLLAEKITGLTGPGKMFFCNSGAEANEALIKLARKFGSETGRYEIITALDSFHGRTMAGISATGQEKVKAGFAPLLPGFVHVPYNDLSAVEAAITGKTAAVLVEGIQGEGGVTVATAAYLAGLRKLTKARNLLLLIDGVQCGMFRTGHFHSYQRILKDAGLAEPFLPDGIAMAKSLGGGFPIGATWMAAPYCDLLQPGSHGSTFGGTPLACAVALEVIQTIQDEKLDVNACKQGERLRAGLESLKGRKQITDVRGFGGIIGISVEGSNLEACQRLAEGGLLTIVAGRNALRFLPPLNVSSGEVDQALELVEKHL
jgi:acetylornithine aminotransferase/acetylornithine/N-succinyldiaminopimelate aminotransferase